MELQRNEHDCHFSSQPFRPRRAGFTLVEILAALAAVAVLLVLVASMMSSTTALIKLSDKSVDADSEARMVFDRMAADFASMVDSSDVDYQFNNLSNQQNGSPTLFFYSEAPGLPASGTNGDNSSVSLIGYRINTSYQMERLGKGLQWTPNASTSTDTSPDGMVRLTYATTPVTTSSTPIPGSSLADVFPAVLVPNSTDANYHVLGDDVFRFTFWFLLKPCLQADGTYQPAIYSSVPYDRRAPKNHTSLNSIGLEDVQAIVVSIVILDSASRQLLPSSTNWGKVAAALPEPANADPFVGPTWEAAIANTSVFDAQAGITAVAGSQVRVYQRVFNLMTPTAP